MQKLADLRPPVSCPVVERASSVWLSQAPVVSTCKALIPGGGSRWHTSGTRTATGERALGCISAAFTPSHFCCRGRPGPGEEAALSGCRDEEIAGIPRQQRPGLCGSLEGIASETNPAENQVIGQLTLHLLSFPAPTARGSSWPWD